MNAATASLNKEVFMTWRVPDFVCEEEPPANSELKTKVHNSQKQKKQESQQQPKQLNPKMAPISKKFYQKPKVQTVQLAQQARAQEPERHVGEPVIPPREGKPAHILTTKKPTNTKKQAPATLKPAPVKKTSKQFVDSENLALIEKLRGAVGLQPEAEASMRKWLQDATPDERKTAIDFFNSMLANKQRPGEAAPRQIPIKNHSKEAEDNTLKFLRLLTPKTRANRWMHTTWHHMPPYHDTDKVDNKSSHYAPTQGPDGRDFVIHPDWG